jgi:hypothetical protein
MLRKLNGHLITKASAITYTLHPTLTDTSSQGRALLPTLYPLKLQIPHAKPKTLFTNRQTLNTDPIGAYRRT